SPSVSFRENGSIQMTMADGGALSAQVADLPSPRKVTGPWNLNFPPHWGAPPSVTLDKLMSWTDCTNEGVRYFSGTATYEKEIHIPSDLLANGRQLWLDLGEVKNFAEVSLNGHDYGVLWKPPFRLNVTDSARPGRNTLIVKVTNLWPNRLIGDEQLPPDCEWNGKQLKAWPQWLLDGKPSPTGRFTFTTWHHYTKDSPLLESGLLGPVMLETTEIVTPR
ncbi:MAG: glycosylhydrolase-like jelly roll fold domain-containing protein, partial [Limisphaerales bacterium]